MNEPTSIAEKLLDRCRATTFSHNHRDSWRNTLSKNLNRILGRAEYELETCGDEADISFARAALEVAERVQEFEGLKLKRK